MYFAKTFRYFGRVVSLRFLVVFDGVEPWPNLAYQLNLVAARPDQAMSCCSSTPYRPIVKSRPVLLVFSHFLLLFSRFSVFGCFLCVSWRLFSVVFLLFLPWLASVFDPSAMRELTLRIK